MDLDRFVASLAIPDDRKAIVRAELADHVACAIEAARGEGRDPDEAARIALGDLEALRRSLEAVESAFAVTVWRAMAHGIVAGLVVALAIAEDGSLVRGAVGALLAIAIAAVLAPPHALGLLRAELRATRVRGAISRGIPIGPALAYAITVMCVPYLVWIGMIVQRALAGNTELEVPWSAYALSTAVILVLLVEVIRARHRVVA